MNNKRSSIFTSIGGLIFVIILVFGGVFILMTYMSAHRFYEATTQRLNKDVAAHIAKFTSPYTAHGLDRKKADSVFYDAMVLSPSIEVYFLDTAGTVMYFQAPDSVIHSKKIPLEKIKHHIQSKGLDFVKGPDPKNPDIDQVFSAAEVKRGNDLLGYIYVILGSNEYRKVSESLFDDHAITLSVQVFTIIFCLSLLISLIYLRRIRRNFRRITSVLADFKQGDYSGRLPMNKFNEFSSIASGFNNMADTLVNSINRLTTSAKERKDFLANISHDLRTPISVARGYVETLREEIRTATPDREKIEVFVQMAEKKIKQLESMVAQLFELSKMESVDFRPKKEPLLIADIIEETVNVAKSKAHEKSIRLSCVGCQHSYWVNADTGMMERLMQNLIDNALKFTPQNGAIAVTVSAVEGELTVAIVNSGNPFSEEQIAWINSENLDKISTAKPHAGLGLSIVIRILQLHKFTYLASVDQQGDNHFSFSMPLYKTAT